MKNLLSKTLLCGVLASSFILVNCQKAPNRAAKAQVSPAAKPQAVKAGDCTAEIATDYDSLKKSDKKIQDKLKSIAGDVSEADIAELDTMVKELNALAKKVMGAIGALKVDACKIYEGNDPKKKQTDQATMSVIRQVRSNAGAAAKAKTKKDNEITLEDKKESSDNLSAGQEFVLDNQDLANALSKKENSRGAVAIAESKIAMGAEAKSFLENKDKTACAINIDKDEEIKINSAIKVIEVGAVKENGQRKSVDVKLEIKTGNGSALVGLSCNIADQKVSEAAKEVRSALGNLIKILDRSAEQDKSEGNGSAPVIPADGGTIPAPAPAAASKASKAQEGLKILDEATK